MNNTNINRYNRGLVARTKSHNSIQNLKKLGITNRRYTAQPQRKQERYKKVGDRMRERYEESRGRQKNGRRKRRRR